MFQDIDGDHVLPANEALAKESVRVAVLEFSRDRKSMSVIANRGGVNELLVKGAPESIIERCTEVLLPNNKTVRMTPQIKAAILAGVDGMASKAWRVLACAYSNNLGALATYDGPNHDSHKLLTSPDNFAQIESNLTYVSIYLQCIVCSVTLL